MNKFRDLWVVCRQHHDMGVVKLMRRLWVPV